MIFDQIYNLINLILNFNLETQNEINTQDEG